MLGIVPARAGAAKVQGTSRGLNRLLAATSAPVLRRSHPTLLRRATYATQAGSSARPISKPPIYGQPHSSTHPHLLSGKELTIGITASEYEERRRKLMARLPEGSRLQIQTILAETATDFHYLTGFDEPDATLALESRPSSPRGYHYTLYVPPKDAHDEMWEGARTGVDNAITVFGADAAFHNSLLASHLDDLLSGSENLFVELPPNPSPSASSMPYPMSNHGPPAWKKRRSSLSKLFNSASPSSGTEGGGGGMWSKPSKPPHITLHSALTSGRASRLEPEIERLRLIKSPAELSLMNIAGEISAHAHTAVMKYASADKGMSRSKVTGRERRKREGDLTAVFEYYCALEGSERPAYVPVVASGANSLVIHYTNNDCELQDGELVLIDAGCEYAHYASDITRTFPVSGKFTEPQKDLYQAVLNVQKECVKRCTVKEEISMAELHRLSCTLMTQELRQIGFKLSPGEVERKLYPHYISHHLGSDLHDCPIVGRSNLSDILVAGNVITVEPGCYVPSDPSYPKHFQGLGIRIEDDIAFTKDGPLNLSVHAPKEILDIEGACQGALEP
ncbi:hypothetical protein QFC21_006999 [Naganishia friedmannii]|uniref:Uncharacterized protein n=1 Tax=Naganishia friedmannii TaxID=89922 RepID=A0ACC2UY70_9TREE|nr:hypothetical protein QFC21_006999 [Naganishia friedmannii]